MNFLTLGLSAFKPQRTQKPATMNTNKKPQKFLRLILALDLGS